MASHQPERVLILEDDENYRRLLTAVLGECSVPFDVVAVGTLAEALAALDAGEPDVMLIDLNVPDSSGYHTFAALRQKTGEACLIVLTSEDDDELAFRAIDGGAYDYLIKRLTHPSAIVRRIRTAWKRQVLERHLQAPRWNGQTIGFLGAKGGVGTSTTALNVATTLARRGIETTFLDLEPGPGTWSRYVQSRADRDLTSLMDRPATVLTLSDLQECTPEPFRCLHLLGMSSRHGTWKPLRREYVAPIISLSRQMSAAIVVDLGSRIDETVETALSHCQFLILVTDCDAASRDWATAVLRQAESIAPESCEIQVVVVERSHGPGLPVPEIAAALKLAPLATVTDAGPALGASYEARVPLAAYHSETEFIHNMQTIVDALSARFRDSLAVSPICRSLSLEKRNCRHTVAHASVG